MNLIVSFSFLWAAPPRLICLHPDSHFTRCVLCRICHTNKSVAEPPTVGTAIVFIPYLTTLLETDVDIFVFMHPRSFFKLCFLICWKVCFFCTIKSLKKCSARVNCTCDARPCREIFTMIFLMCKQTKNQHIQKQI